MFGDGVEIWCLGEGRERKKEKDKEGKEKMVVIGGKKKVKKNEFGVK